MSGLFQQSISRRAALGSLAAAAALSGTRGRAAGEAELPNIVWLVSEDNNPWSGAYGDRLAHTPASDALATQGTVFRNVYSTAPVCAPSRFAILTGVYPESCAPANHMRAQAKLPKEFRTYPELMRSAGYFCTNNEKTDYNCDVDPAAIWDRHGGEATWRDRPAGKPFLSVHNFMVTHESRLFSATPGRVRPDMVRLPAYLPDTPEIREDFASYYNLIERMDAELAEKLAELEADGLADDTIVFHYSDNGGVLPRSKRYCYEEGLRCQLIVYAPPKWQHLMPVAPGQDVSSPVSLIDLAPTLLSIARIPVPPQMAGKAFMGPQARGPQRYAFGMRNRMDERLDFIRTVTDGRWRYIRNYMPHRPWGQHGAFQWQAKGYQSWEREHRAGRLNAQQARFFGQKPFEELYDLERDPDQVQDLATDPAHRACVEKLSRALDEHMVAINDNGFLPESMPGEGYFPSRNSALYPLETVMRLGETAARGNPASLGELTGQLDSPTEVLRYWAAVGLLILGQQAAPSLAALQRAMNADRSVHVRIVAAEALAKLGKAGSAVPLLAQILDSAAEWQIKLQAIDALTFMGDLAAPALPAAQRLAEGGNTYLRSAGKYLALQLLGRYTPETTIFSQTGPG